MWHSVGVMKVPFRRVLSGVVVGAALLPGAGCNRDRLPLMNVRLPANVKATRMDPLVQQTAKVIRAGCEDEALQKVYLAHKPTLDLSATATHVVLGGSSVDEAVIVIPAAAADSLPKLFTAFQRGMARLEQWRQTGKNPQGKEALLQADLVALHRLSEVHAQLLDAEMHATEADPALQPLRSGDVREEIIQLQQQMDTQRPGGASARIENDLFLADLMR